MNVSFEQIDAVNGMITVELKREDFASDVNKEVAAMGVRHPLKGFRPGKAPKNLLMKFYGPSVTADVIDRKVGRAVYDYIRENKLQVLAEPLPNEDTKVDIMKDEEMAFKYDVGLAPAIELKLNKRINVPYYNIEVTDQMVDDAIAHDRKRLGTLVDGEVSDKESMLRGSMIELDEQGNDKQDGIKVERTLISPRYMTDDDEAAKFVGVKVGDTFVFNPHKANGGNIAELASMLNLDRSEADVKSDFRITIEEIKVNKDAEMNEEFFKGVLGTETEVKDEAAFREAMREMIKQANVPESNYRFTVDAQRILTEKAGDLQLPEEFLKRFLKLRREQDEKNNNEVTDEEAQNMFKQLRWQLVKGHRSWASRSRKRTLTMQPLCSHSSSCHSTASTMLPMTSSASRPSASCRMTAPATPSRSTLSTTSSMPLSRRPSRSTRRASALRTSASFTRTRISNQMFS